MVTVQPVPREAAPANVRTVSHGAITWVDVVEPDRDALDYLAARFPFHELDLDDVLSKRQRPKLDEYDDYLFFILHFPVFEARTRLTSRSQVSIFLGPDYVVTAHRGNLRPILQLFEEASSRDDLKEKLLGQSPSYLFYQLLDRLVDYCGPIVNRVAGSADTLQEGLLSLDTRSGPQEMVLLRRELIALRRIIRPQIGIIASLEHRRYKLLDPELEVYFSDVADHIRQTWDALEDLREVVEGLNDAFNWYTTNRTNEVIKLLTAIAASVLPAVFISQMYGQNIRLPLADQPYAFWFLAGAQVLVTASLILFFRWRRWI
ncbi:MAG: magnesium transporter CorA family protein [Chloroflexi bacterium]|nr:magnesium transporter CorA family protein [Chloroflexota bacterium]